MDQARDTALLAQVSQTLAELAAARARLAAGTYGVCEHCGRPVAEARLAARPEARLCIACASRG
ncbi:MAG: TraR/DksA family transcriptional regulator [Janthinobacterium lividum]